MCLLIGGVIFYSAHAFIEYRYINNIILKPKVNIKTNKRQQFMPLELATRTMSMILIIFYLPILLFGQTSRWDLIESIQNKEKKGTEGTWRDSVYCPDDTWMGGFRLY